MCASIELNNYSQLKKSTNLQVNQVFVKYYIYTIYISASILILNHGVS